MKVTTETTHTITMSDSEWTAIRQLLANMGWDDFSKYVSDYYANILAKIAAEVE